MQGNPFFSRFKMFCWCIKNRFRRSQIKSTDCDFDLASAKSIFKVIVDRTVISDHFQYFSWDDAGESKFVWHGSSFSAIRTRLWVSFSESKSDRCMKDSSKDQHNLYCDLMTRERCTGKTHASWYRSESLTIQCTLYRLSLIELIAIPQA